MGTDRKPSDHGATPNACGRIHCYALRPKNVITRAVDGDAMIALLASPVRGLIGSSSQDIRHLDR
jgi:hypothetical protein